MMSMSATPAFREMVATVQRRLCGVMKSSPHDVFSLAKTSDMLLYRIPLDGTSVGLPVSLYHKVPIVWDSLTRPPRSS